MKQDTTAAVFRTDPERLARVFDLVVDDRPVFDQAELGAILRHQLRTQVEFDLGCLDDGSRRLLKAAGEGGDGNTVVRTFGDLFQSASPPLQLLVLTKRFAKDHLNHPESHLPSEIATVLYYASILAALLRWDRRITGLTNAELCQGIRQVLRQPWLDPYTRELFRTGLAELEASP